MENGLLDTEIILNGDLNARTSDAKDYNDYGTNDPHVQDFQKLLGDDIGVTERPQCYK